MKIYVKLFKATFRNAPPPIKIFYKNKFDIQLKSSMYFCWDLFIKFICLLFIYLFIYLILFKNYIYLKSYLTTFFYF